MAFPWVFIFLFIFSFAPVNLGQTLPSGDSNWRLAFSDEFNGNTLDNTKWTARYKEGNFGEAEKHFYIPEQVSVRGGDLVINSTKSLFVGKQYVSAWVDSKDKFYTTHGHYEARAKFSGAYGLWPAIWSLSQNLCVWVGHEYDIGEYVGRSRTRIAQSIWYWPRATCSNSLSQRYVADAGNNQPVDLSLDYHVYAMTWLPENITFYVDGVKTKSFTPSDMQGGLFDTTPHFWILNVAVGGNYPQDPRDSNVWPAFSYIDYVKTWVYRRSCNENGGLVCSGHGCCNQTTVLCQCDAGWSGSSCEYYLGSYVNTFTTYNNQYTPITDTLVNGWDNGQAMYSATNVAMNNGLTLTISTNGCPSGCIGKLYSSGAWNSGAYYEYGTFSATVRGTNIPGTSVSVGASGQNSQMLEQIMLVLLGTNTNQMIIRSWHTGYYYQHTVINLGFDASQAFHNYTFVYGPTSLLFFVDNRQVYSTNEVVPSGILALGIYYTVDPETANRFVYNGASTISARQASWLTYPGDEFRIGTSCDVNECQTVPSPCGSNAVCANTLGSFTCTCNQGYQKNGSVCVDTNECTQGTNNCNRDAICTNIPGSFTCNCKSGYTGNGVTCTDVNECSAGFVNDCNVNANCVNTPGSYQCTCKSGYTGNGFSCSDINECAPGFVNDCNTRATCTNTAGSYYCTCLSGYTGNGITCTDINECTAGFVNNCSVNANCANTPGSYQCTCKSGYTGNGLSCSDINECASGFVNNCSARATCTNTQGSYYCTCSSGYTGNGFTCTDINECSSTNNCSANAACTNTPGSYTCACKSGYTGNGFTCTDINECASGFANECSSLATCTNTQGSYYCNCSSGYTGSGYNCIDINECQSTNDCSPNAVCSNTQGSYTCTCKIGFSGSGTLCTDVNECVLGTNNCDSNSTCINTIGSYTCTCRNGFTVNGSNCLDENECLQAPCGFGSCSNIIGSYQCNCQQGFAIYKYSAFANVNGTTCLDVDECVSETHNCTSLSTCNNTVGNYFCVGAPLFVDISQFNRSNSTIDIYWQAPIFGVDMSNLSFVLQMIAKDSSWVTIYQGLETNFTIDGLQSVTTYNFRISYNISSYLSNYSPVSGYTTNGLPVLPSSSLKFPRYSSNYILVQLPSVPPSGPTVASYLVSMYADPTPTPAPVPSPSPLPSVSPSPSLSPVPSLSPSPSPDPSPSPSPSPSLPSALYAIYNSGENSTINNNSTGNNDTDGPVWTTLEISGSSHKFTGLNGNTAFHFMFQTSNVYGASPSSSISNFTTVPSFCGDQECNPSESCQTCLLDCGACSQPTCPGSPACSNNGICSQGVCLCYNLFSAPDCSMASNRAAISPGYLLLEGNVTENNATFSNITQTNNTIIHNNNTMTNETQQTNTTQPDNAVQNGNQTPPFFILTSSSFVDDSGNLQASVSFGISIISIIETNQSGSVVKNISIPTQNFTVDSTSTALNYMLYLFENSTTLKIAVSVYTNPETIILGGQSMSISQNGVVCSIMLQNWPFEKLENHITITVSAQQNSTRSPVISTNDNSLSSNLRWLNVLVDKTSLYSMFIQQGVVDGVLTNVKITLDDTNQVSATIPYFWEQSEIAVVYYVAQQSLVSVPDQIESSSGKKWYESILFIALVSGIGGLLLIGIIIFVIVKRRQNLVSVNEIELK